MDVDKLKTLLEGVIDYDQTPEEARAELEADGVDVDAFLDRVHSETSRFFIEHGVIHDRKTGRHLTQELEPDYPAQLLTLLRGFDSEITRLSTLAIELASALEGARLDHAKWCKSPCDCGADSHNARITEALKKVKP